MTEDMSRAKVLVLARYPEARSRKWGGWREMESGWAIEIGAISWSTIGSGETEAAAWTSAAEWVAASRLKSEPKEAAPEAVGPLDDIGRECIVTRDTHRLLTETSEDFADRMRRALIAERRQRLPEPATEGAPEVIAAAGKLDNRFTFQVRRDMPKDAVFAGTEAGAYLMLRFPSKSDEPKAEGEEKATEMKRPEYQWARLLSDNTQNHSVYLTEAADAYMDALESRNAELTERVKELEEAQEGWSKNAMDHLAALQESERERDGYKVAHERLLPAYDAVLARAENSEQDADQLRDAIRTHISDGLHVGARSAPLRDALQYSDEIKEGISK